LASHGFWYFIELKFHTVKHKHFARQNRCASCLFPRCFLSLPPPSRCLTQHSLPPCKKGQTHPCVWLFDGNNRPKPRHDYQRTSSIFLFPPRLHHRWRKNRTARLCNPIVFFFLFLFFVWLEDTFIVLDTRIPVLPTDPSCLSPFVRHTASSSLFPGERGENISVELHFFRHSLLANSLLHNTLIRVILTTDHGIIVSNPAPRCLGT
jgi:hypothetical protein